MTGYGRTTGYRRTMGYGRTRIPPPTPLDTYIETLKFVKILSKKKLPESIEHLIASFNGTFKINKDEPYYECFHITKKGNEVIKGITNVIYAYEHLSHDGYDADGPESYLWDLCVFHMKNNKIMKSEYHWENWFCPGDRDRTYMPNDPNETSVVVNWEGRN